MDVRYCVIPFTTQHLCDGGMSFKVYSEAVKLAKEEATHYGKALIVKTVWNNEGRIVKQETLVLKADGSFYLM